MQNALVGEEAKYLIISFGKPYKPISHETISRWIKSEVTDAEADTSVLKPHSCRSVSSSKTTLVFPQLVYWNGNVGKVNLHFELVTLETSSMETT